MKAFDLIIKAGVCLLLLFTLLAFGAVYLWAYTAMELIVFFLILCSILKMIWKDGRVYIPKTYLNIPIFLFIAFIIFQLVPLPNTLIKTLSPETFHFYRDTLYALDRLRTPSDSHEYLRFTLSLSPYSTKTELLKVLSYAGVFFVIVGNFTTKGSLNRLILYIIIIGFLFSLFALIQHFTWNGRIYWVRELKNGGSPFGTFINRNNFAGFINMLIPLPLGMFITTKERNKKMLFGFTAVIMATALFFSLSRGGIFSFISGLMFMAAVLFITRYEGEYKKSLVILSSFMIAVLLYLLYIGIGPVIDRLSTLTRMDALLRESRLIVWKATFGIFKDYPLTGTGLDTFETVFPAYRPLQVSNLRWLDAHNDYIQFMAETGIVGIVIALSFFGVFFYNVFFAIKASQNTDNACLLISLLSSVMAFMISIIFTFNTHIPANALMFSILIAVIVRLTIMIFHERKQTDYRKEN